MFRQLSNNARLTLRLSLLAVGTFVLGVDSFVLAGLLPAVAVDLHVSVATAGQLTTAFAVAYAIGSPVIATATGRLDRRIVLAGGLAVFLLGMMAQAAGPSYGTVLAGRILAAIGAAAFQANAFAVAGFLAPPERRARALAIIGAGASLASVVGVPFGVLVGQLAGWRGAMWMIAALSAIAGVLVLALPAVHLPPASLRERLGLFADRRMLTLLAVTALVLVPLYAVVNYLAPLVGASDRNSPRVLLALLVFGVAFFVGNRLVGWFADRFGPVRALLAGLAVAIVALATLWLVHPRFGAELAAIAALGLSGPFQAIPQQTRVFTAGGKLATVASGLNGSMLYLGSGIGTALGGLVLGLAGIAWVPLAAAFMAAVGLVVTAATASVDARTPALR